MALTSTASSAGVPVTQADDRWSFAVIYVAAFLVMLPIALVAQSLMLKWRPWFPGAESEKSLIGGVKAAVSSFMSLLI